MTHGRCSVASTDEELPDLLVANTDVTIQSPIDEYYQNLSVRLDDLKTEFTKIEARTGHDQTFEDYIQGDKEFAEGVQQNSQRYYDALKVLRADTQIFYPVPSEVYRDEWDDVIMDDTMEYTHCRYTPVVTEDPRDFGIDGYTLRLQREDRRIRLLICVTLYNEDQDTLRKTLLGICDNLEVLYEKFTLADGRKGLDWQEVAVVLLQDGLMMADQSVIAAATVQGFFSPVVLQEDVLGTPTSLHLFEYTARYKKHAGIDNYPPLQVIFGTKTKNKGKLDSHCWYFDAFSYLIQPEYCVLFDAGTRPMPTALKSVCTHFQRYPNVGALTGELRVERPYRTFLASVQFCEWKVSHLLQKPIESICGFLTVLPGAFSAFRWLAIDGEPLRRYFYGLYSQAELNAFEANMYLAEDRILCLEVVAKKGCQYRLEYVKEAIAEADPVIKLVDLMKQRRRWLNGTFFAMLYALGNMSRIWSESGHSFVRKLVLTSEFFYLTLVTIIGTWFGIGIFFVMLTTLLEVAFDGPGWLQAIGYGVELLYLFLLVTELIINLKNKPEPVEKIHSFCAIYFALYMLVFTGVSISFFVTNSSFTFAGVTEDRLGLLVVLLMSAIGGILLTALLHGDLAAIICSGIQYWLMVPTFFNILQVNAFCNADDISWGTKNLDKSGNHEAVKTQSKKLAYTVRPTHASRAFWKAMGDLQSHLFDQEHVQKYNARKQAKLRAFASYLLIAWVGSNIILVAIILIISKTEWEVCSVTESEMAVSAIRSQAEDYDKALAIADLVQTAATMLMRGSQLYPFDGLQGFPQAYPLLVSGDAQANVARGSRVTVLANATDLFGSLDQSMPTFEDWLAESMGINASATMEEFGSIYMPMPSNTSGFDASVTCTTESGYTYYLQAQFLLLMIIVVFQVCGSIIFIFGTWWRRFTGAAFGTGIGRIPEGGFGYDAEGKILDTDSEDDMGSDFEVAIQPSHLRMYGVPSDIDTVTSDQSYTPTHSSDGGSFKGVRRRGGMSPRYID